jgi:GxxExxY protein
MQDMLIENEIILEIKAVNTLEPVFAAQLITYLKLAGKKLGYFINFNVHLLKMDSEEL